MDGSLQLSALASLHLRRDDVVSVEARLAQVEAPANPRMRIRFAVQKGAPALLTLTLC
jgi:hypothetical protein